MQSVFVSLYRFFLRRKTLFWSLFGLTTALWLWLALHIRLKEDVSSMLPDSEAITAMNDVATRTQAGEQIIFLVSMKDSSMRDPERLMLAAGDLQKELYTRFGKWIDTILLQVSGGREEAVVNTLQRHIPLFLEEKDYAVIDSLLDAGNIKSNLEQNRKILLSPASMALKQFIAQDPAGISNIVWKKLGALQIDPNYELYEGYLFTQNQTVLSFFLKPAYKSSETGQNAAFFQSLDVYLESYGEQHRDIHITYFGGPAVAAGNASQLRTDTILTLSVTIVLLLLLTYYFFRRKRTPVLLLVPVVYGALMGLGIVYLIQGSVSVIAIGAGAIILGIAIDFSIHFLSHARHEKTMQATIAAMAQPLTIGSFTTIAAFLSLRFLHTPILQDLGLFAAMSLLGAALCTLVFLPHFPLGIQHHHANTVFDKLALLKPEKNKWLVMGVFVLTPVMLYFATDVRFDSDLMHLNYLSPQLQKAQDEVSKVNAQALSAVFVVANAGDDEQAIQKLEAAKETIDKLVATGSVKAVSNPASLLPSKLEQEKRRQRWSRFWNEERKNSYNTSIRKLAPEVGFRPEAFKGFEELISNAPGYLTEDDVRILQSLFPGGFSADTNSHYAIASLRVPPEHRKEVFDALSRVKEVTITDRQQGALQLVDILKKDFNNIALYSSLIVFFALLIGYGRLELAIISFLPMVISWIWILGLMSLLGLSFNIVNIIISSLIFGLGDDYAIFTMDGLVEKYKTGKHKLTSVRAAVYVSALTVVIGLGVLLLAKHPALKSIAFISVTGLLCVLFISQTLQPFLFNWFIQNRADKKFLPFTLRSFFISVFAFAYFFSGSWILTLAGILFTRLWPFGKERGKYYFHKMLSAYTWSMMHIMRNVKTRVYGRDKTDFNKPAIYIANHSSFLDILCTTMLHPKMVLLTNKWVWRSPVFGAVVRMAEYYPVADGAEDSIEPLRDLVNRGYSIIVFPEGTRSYSDKINRFHKGAFYLAEELKLDIVPLVLHGMGYTMQKGDWLLKDGTCAVHIMDPIRQDDLSFGKNYSERTRNISKWMRTALQKIKEENETPSYFRERLLRSYTYKGPGNEWYCRIKTKLENNYETFHAILPREGKFYDLGCGYGFMTYMLHWAAPGRHFTGVDYDEEKIETAQHQPLRDEHIHFETADLNAYQPADADAIIISDVLHYLLPGQQEALLERSFHALKKDGLLIVRDGIAEMNERFETTKQTEVWSTQILKFNKTQNELHFISRAFIEAFALKYDMSLEVIDQSKRTANLIFVMKKG